MISRKKDLIDGIMSTMTKMIFQPTTGLTRVFVAYSSEDKDFVADVVASLNNAGLEPYIAEWDNNADTHLTSKVEKGISESLHFVPILSKSSVYEQWINQEIGFAYSLKYLYEIQKDQLLIKRRPLMGAAVKDYPDALNPIEIYPIVYKPLKDVVKGWINRDIDLILYDDNDRDWKRHTIFRLFSQIRYRLERFYSTPFVLSLKCPHCESDFTAPLPKHAELLKPYHENRPFPIKCAVCEEEIHIDPVNFTILKP